MVTDTNEDLTADLCDGPAAAKLLGISLPAFHARLCRGRIRESAIVRIGSAVLYRKSELINQRDLSGLVAKVKRDLRRKLGKDRVRSVRRMLREHRSV